MGKDNFKRVEAILYDYRNIIAEIKCLEIDITEEEREFRGCGAIDTSKEGGKSNAFNSTVENEVVERERKIEKLKKEILKRKALIAKIESVKESLSKNETELLELKYLNGDYKNWEEIATELKFSSVYCRVNLRKKIIEKFEKVL